MSTTLFEWAIKVARKRLKPSSIHVYSSMWARFEQGLKKFGVSPGEESVAQLADVIRSYGDYPSQKRLFALVRWVYQTLEEAGLPLKNHTDELFKLYLRDERAEHEAFTPDTVKAMAAAARADVRGWKGVRLAAMLTLLGDTGLRSQELIALRKSDFNEGPPATLKAGLGPKVRTLSLSPDCSLLLTEWLGVYPAPAATPWLFVANPVGNQMDPSTVWRQIKRIAVKTFGEDFGKDWQTGTGVIRAGVAKSLQLQGLPEVDIKDFLGHRLESSTGELLERVRLAEHKPSKSVS
jgi:integrase